MNLFSTSAMFHKNISHLNLALYFHNFPSTYVPLGTRGWAIISAVPTDPRAIYSTLLADCLTGQCSATRWFVATDKTNLHVDDEAREFCHHAALLWTHFASLWKFFTHWHVLNWNAVQSAWNIAGFIYAFQIASLNRDGWPTALKNSHRTSK